MSSNFTIQRKCVHCNRKFNAKTTVTRFCGKLCNKRYNASRQRNQTLEAEKQQAINLAIQKTLQVQDVEFLDAQKAALLLGVSRNLIYQLINTGKLLAYNISIRRTIILRKDIDLLFKKRAIAIIPKQKIPLRPKIENCYYMVPES